MRTNGNPMQGILNVKKCGAYARTTGKPCKSPAMANGRCRMHGGKATGRPTSHGKYSQASIRQNREWKFALSALRTLLAAYESRRGAAEMNNAPVRLDAGLQIDGSAVTCATIRELGGKDGRHRHS